MSGSAVEYKLSPKERCVRVYVDDVEVLCVDSDTVEALHLSSRTADELVEQADFILRGIV